MGLRKIADNLGIAKYPEVLDQVYEAGSWIDICNCEKLADLEAQYGVFGQYYEAVLRGAEDLKRDADRLCWGQVVATYVQNSTVTEARSIPVPETDGTPAGDMMPMLILATLIPSSVEDYRRRGFSEDMIDRSLKAYAGGMSIVESRVGRPGVNKTYYSWLGLYAKTAIFNYGGFNFELRKTPPVATYLRNRQDGQVTVVMCSGTFHRDGMVLGTAGYADPEGSFAAEFRETEDAWYGHPVVEHRVSSQLTCFEKAQWECALAPGEDVLSIHIPRKTDLSAEAIDKAISGAMEIAKNSFPEFHIKTVFCSSWLMEPYLEKILGQKSRIYGFQSRFHRYPVKSAGKEVFSFVFTKNYESLEELPENTTLERALKQRYLNGEFVYCFAGAIL